MKKYIVIIFFALFCISSFLGGVYFNNFINNWDLLILTFGLLGFYLCLLENKITKELFLLLFFIILVPLIFFSSLSLINNTLVSSINDWIGFLGAYLGAIGAIGGIWWQLNEEKKEIKLKSSTLLISQLEIICEKIDNILRNEFHMCLANLNENIRIPTNNFSLISDYSAEVFKANISNICYNSQINKDFFLFFENLIDVNFQLLKIEKDIYNNSNNNLKNYLSEESEKLTPYHLLLFNEKRATTELLDNFLRIFENSYFNIINQYNPNIEENKIKIEEFIYFSEKAKLIKDSLEKMKYILNTSPKLIKMLKQHF